jgi:hypothetical protein
MLFWHFNAGCVLPYWNVVIWSHRPMLLPFADVSKSISIGQITRMFIYLFTQFILEVWIYQYNIYLSGMFITSLNDAFLPCENNDFSLYQIPLECNLFSFCYSSFHQLRNVNISPACHFLGLPCHLGCNLFSLNLAIWRVKCTRSHLNFFLSSWDVRFHYLSSHGM